jgi:hypothetical protein
MRFYPCLAALLLYTCAQDSARATDDWSFVTSWVGKYPSATVDGMKGGLLVQPAIKAAITKLLPNSEAEAMIGLTTDAPVRQLDGFVIINKCRPHNCPSDMATVVVDIKNERLWIGFFSRGKISVSTRWYGLLDDYSVLPEEVKKDFLSRHGD